MIRRARRSAKPRATAIEPSVEPLSHTSTSKPSSTSCCESAASCSPRKRSPFSTGMTTDTAGVAASSVMPGEGSPVHCAEQLRQTAAVSHAYDSAWEQITRTLVVTSKSPWPSMNGAAIRSAEVVRSLTRHGDVDLAIIGESDAEAPPSALGLRRSHVFPLDRHSRFRARVNRVGALAGGLAVPVAASDYRTARRQLERWAASDYDVVWFGGVEV